MPIQVGAASLSQVVASSATYPHEVLRSRMHVDGTASPALMAVIARQVGPWGSFWAGLPPTCPGGGPSDLALSVKACTLLLDWWMCKRSVCLTLIKRVVSAFFSSRCRICQSFNVSPQMYACSGSMFQSCSLFPFLFPVV